VLLSMAKWREFVPRDGSGYMVNFSVVGSNLPKKSAAELLNQTIWFLSVIIL